MGAVPNSGEVASHLEPASKKSAKIYRFGSFELRTETGELWKHGIRVKLQIKPLQVLEALLARPGEVVTREDLCGKLWPTGTFVDFESGLNTATNRLRVALGDSADAPRYIETLPRLGYRFICPVTEIVQEERAPTWPVVPRHVSPGDTAPEQQKNNNRAGSETKREIPVSAAVKPEHGGKLLNKLTVVGAAALSVLLVGLAFEYFRSSVGATSTPPQFHQLTFRTGTIGPARFIPGSQKVIYTARWQSGNHQTSVVDEDGSNSRVIDFATGVLASVSKGGSVALIDRDSSRPGEKRISRISLTGSNSGVLAEGAEAADWSPDERELATVQEHGTESLIEFPLGHIVYSSPGWINCLRVSPRGDRVAFLDHPVRDDDAGYVRVVDRKGVTRVLTEQWDSAEGLAWSPSADEVWFTASKDGMSRVLYAVSTNGKLRQVSNAPSSLRILDISSKGHVLLAVDDLRMTLSGALAGEAAESDLSKLDGSHVDDISQDGKRVLFTEGGETAGRHYTAYIRDKQSHSTLPIGPGRGLALSADGSAALTIDPQDRHALTLTRIASDQRQKISGSGFEYQWAKFLPGSHAVIVGGAYPGEPLGVYTQKIDGGKPAPLAGAPYMDYVQVSPDESKIAGFTSKEILVFELATKTIRHFTPGSMAIPVGWSIDNNDLYVATLQNSQYRILKTDVRTGKFELWKAIRPSETAGFAGLAGVVAAPDAGAYAYSTHVNLSRLYVVDGWS
jgi:eukaryotic-like serine/threonine-protein kinase